MPSVSQAQANLMAGISHGWHPTGMKSFPSKKVAKEFNKADKGRSKKKLPKHVSGKEQAAALEKS